MKPAELYKSPIIKTETELYVLSKYIHEISLEGIETPKTTEVEIRYYIDECFDGERGLAMFSVWFKGKPFMVCHEAGRGNRDYYNRYVTDAQIFSDFLAYVVTLLPKEEREAINPEQDLTQLDEFYGWPTTVLYDPSPKPKFKVGDVVMAKVLENHLRDAYAFEKAKWIVTRCEIVLINPYNPTNTYHLRQMDRRWETEAEVRDRGGQRAEMVTKPNEGNVGASGNDETVQATA